MGDPHIYEPLLQAHSGLIHPLCHPKALPTQEEGPGWILDPLSHLAMWDNARYYYYSHPGALLSICDNTEVRLHVASYVHTPSSPVAFTFILSSDRPQFYASSVPVMKSGNALFLLSG